MSFTIAADGSVKDAAVTKSSGNSDLDGAARKCVSTWLYKPASKDGRPVAIPWNAVVTFNLQEATLPPTRLDSQSCAHPSASAPPAGPTGVSFTVGADGSVKDVSVNKSSGDAALDQIGVACVSKWQFKPATRDGEAVEVRGSTQFDWKE